MDVIINKKPVSLPILPILALISTLILGFMSARIASVGGDEVGVFVNNLTGNVSVKLQSGSSLYNGLYTDFYTLNKTEGSIEMSKASGDVVRIKTGDGSDIELDVMINYRLIADNQSVEIVALECGLSQVQPYDAMASRRGELEDAYKQQWVRVYSRSIVRQVFGELEPKDFYDAGARDDKAQKARRELNLVLASHGLEVTRVVPSNYTYYTEYKELIDKKKAADQETEKQEQEFITAQRDQERQIAVADAEVKRAIAQEDGRLQKAFLTAEADSAKARLGVEADAYSAITSADAQFTRAKNSSEGQFALVSAEAEGLRKLAESLAGEGGLNLVKLKYAEVLSRARISGVPYATDPRIQKVEIDTNGVLNLGEIKK